MQESLILNSNGIPFDEFTASQVANALTNATGISHVSIMHQQGYAVVVNGAQKMTHESSLEFNEIGFRPAWRSQIPALFMFTIGLLCIIFTESMMLFVGLDKAQNFLYEVIGKTFNWQWVIVIFSIAAALLTFFYTIKIIYSIYAHFYFIGPKGLEETKGIVSRNKIRVEFKDIRTQSLHQTFMGRLLGIGSIDVFTSGSNRAELSFSNISNPSAIMVELTKRKKALS